jgi:hypothetical protein
LGEVYKIFCDPGANPESLITIDKQYLNTYLEEITLLVQAQEHKLRSFSELIVDDTLRQKNPKRYKFRKELKEWAKMMLHRYMEAAFPQGDFLISRTDYENSLIKHLKWDHYTAVFFLKDQEYEKLCFGPSTPELTALKEQFFPERDIPEYIVNMIQELGREIN